VRCPAFSDQPIRRDSQVFLVGNLQRLSKLSYRWPVTSGDSVALSHADRSCRRIHAVGDLGVEQGEIDHDDAFAASMLSSRVCDTCDFCDTDLILAEFWDLACRKPAATDCDRLGDLAAAGEDVAGCRKFVATEEQ
jgi:hypothetical protein